MRVRFIPTTALSAALPNRWPSAIEACANPNSFPERNLEDCGLRPVQPRDVLLQDLG